MSARQSPPIADRDGQIHHDIAGGVTAWGLRHAANAAESAPPNPIASAVSVNNTERCERNTQFPVASILSVGYRAVDLSTRKVLRARGEYGPERPLFSQLRAPFLHLARPRSTAP